MPKSPRPRASRLRAGRPRARRELYLGTKSAGNRNSPTNQRATVFGRNEVARDIMPVDLKTIGITFAERREGVKVAVNRGLNPNQQTGKTHILRVPPSQLFPPRGLEI